MVREFTKRIKRWFVSEDIEEISIDERVASMSEEELRRNYADLEKQKEELQQKVTEKDNELIRISQEAENTADKLAAKEKELKGFAAQKNLVEKAYEKESQKVLQLSKNLQEARYSSLKEFEDAVNHFLLTEQKNATPSAIIKKCRRKLAEKHIESERQMSAEDEIMRGTIISLISEMIYKLPDFYDQELLDETVRFVKKSFTVVHKFRSGYAQAKSAIEEQTWLYQQLDAANNKIIKLNAKLMHLPSVQEVQAYVDLLVDAYINNPRLLNFSEEDKKNMEKEIKRRLGNKNLNDTEVINIIRAGVIAIRFKDLSAKEEKVDVDLLKADLKATDAAIDYKNMIEQLRKVNPRAIETLENKLADANELKKASEKGIKVEKPQSHEEIMEEMISQGFVDKQNYASVLKTIYEILNTLRKHANDSGQNEDLERLEAKPKMVLKKLRKNVIDYLSKEFKRYESLEKELSVIHSTIKEENPITLVKQAYVHQLLGDAYAAENQAEKAKAQYDKAKALSASARCISPAEGKERIETEIKKFEDFAKGTKNG